MHGIGGHDSPGDLRRGQQGRFQRNLIGLVGHGLLVQHDAGLRLIEGHQVLAALIWGRMPQRAPQGFPIEGDLTVLLARWLSD